LEKFLIINPFGIGDVLFTTPVIRAIKENRPDSFIGYWCNQRVAQLLRADKKIDKIFALSRGDIKKISAHSKLKGLRESLKLFFEIKKENFDTAFDYSLDSRYGLVSKLAGIKKRIGFNYKNRGRFLTDRLELEGYSNKHVVDYYLQLLNFINFKPLSRNLELAVPVQDKEKAKREFSGYGIKEGDLVIAIAPGGGQSWGRDSYLKHWPVENFARLADNLSQGFAAKILILGDESEAGLAAALSAGMSNKPIDLVGKTDLRRLAAFIDCAALLVANDGGPLHIGVALKKKTVSFFGPVDPLVYGPYPVDETRHIVLRKRIECGPCYRNFRLLKCSHDKACLRGISVEEALQAVSKLLVSKEA